MSASDFRIEQVRPERLASLIEPREGSLRRVGFWRIDDDAAQALAPRLAGTLSDDERDRARTFARPLDATRFVARRGLLRGLLAAYRGCAPDEIRFTADAFGRPCLSAPDGPPVAFSLAQTDGAALLAVSDRGPLGVDLERDRPGMVVEDIAEVVFSAQELRALRAAAPARRRHTFFSTWVRKEALLKALGTGLAADATRYGTASSRTPGRWTASHDSRALRGWILIDLDAGDGLHAALAARQAAE